MRYPAQGRLAQTGGGWQAATFPLADDLLVLLAAGRAHGGDPSLLLTSGEGRLSYHNMQTAVSQDQGGKMAGRKGNEVQTQNPVMSSPPQSSPPILSKTVLHPVLSIRTESRPRTPQGPALPVSCPMPPS